MKNQIFIIEDCEMMQCFLKNYLKKEYDVRIAPNKLEAKILLENMVMIPDLILMDINLPDGSGLDLISELSSNVRFRNVQIIALSGAKNQDIRCKSLENGANDFMSKPFLPKELGIRIKKLIQYKERLKEAIERELMPTTSMFKMAF